MENARCRAFIEAVDCGSISAAAESLGYTPSAVSQLVSSLEKELGLKLFVRTQKGVTLTSEGEAMVPLVRSYLAREREIYQYADELKGVFTGTLTLAAYPSIALTWLPGIVRRFKNDYPGISISIKESIREEIFEHLEQNRADLGFLAYADPMPFEWITLAESRVIAAIPEDHPLAGAEVFPVKACEEGDFILGSRGNEAEILEILKKHKAHPRITYTTYDTPATLALVRMGLGVSFVNELSAMPWNEHLVKLPLDPPEKIRFGIALPSRDHLTNAARKFLEYSLSYLKEKYPEQE